MVDHAVKMSKILHRHTKADLPYAVDGDGPYIIARNGKRYLDACGGAAVSCLGHNHPVIIAAIKAQLDKIPYAHTSFFTTEVSEQLADELVAKAPEGIAHAYFVSGGSEANEAALKLARQYFLEIGEPQRRLFIAREQSYHGNTLATLALGGNRWRKAPFEPLLSRGYHIPPCYPYRYQREDESDADYGLRSANHLESMLHEIGPENVIAFVAETVVGATAGVLPPAPGYFKRIKEICDQFGILLILDEVMCGIGRTGTLFSCEQDDITADLITVAKGLGSGYQPVGATLLSGRIYQAIAAGSGLFQHGHTYICHPTAAASALATQQVIEQENLLDNVKLRSHQLFDELQQRLDDHPHVGDIRGRGLFIGIELVEDKKTKKPFDPIIPLHHQIRRAAMDDGLLCYPMNGTIDGKNGHHILLAPPFIIGEQQVEEISNGVVSAINSAIDKILI